MFNDSMTFFVTITAFDVIALPYRHLNAISKPTFSLILNWRHKRLCIPRRTLWRYTNVVLLYDISDHLGVLKRF